MPVAIALVLSGAERKPAEGRDSNGVVEVAAKVFLDKAEVRRAVGVELEEAIAVVEVRLAPRTGHKLTIARDDFELWSGKNGSRSTPFAPSQIAGAGVLVVSSGKGGAGVASQDNGPAWRRPTGDGRPERIGGGSPTIGNVGSAGETTARAGRDTSRKSTLELLEEKVLPEKETSEPVEGLLYFYLEGRHKPKDVSLHYKTPAGKLVVGFKD